MLMQGMFLTITVAVVISNFLADILNSVLDPRAEIVIRAWSYNIILTKLLY